MNLPVPERPSNPAGRDTFYSEGELYQEAQSFFMSDNTLNEHNF